MAKSRNQYIAENSESNYDDDLIAFSLIDKATVSGLKRTIDETKDENWNIKQLNSKLLQGILNGDPVQKIAESFLEVVGNNEASANRNARTMVTGAENKGRQDSYENLADQGVVQKKVWIATPDDRTRESHLELDGEEVDIDQAFSNELMFPGDQSGDPSEWWNCRCSMRDHIVGFKKPDGSITYVNGERGETLHDKQMEELKNKINEESASLKERYNDNVKNLSKSDVMDKFIDSDSYINDKDYRNVLKERTENINKQSDVITEINKLESKLSKMEAVPKPRSEWNAEDMMKSIMGKTPMIQSDESRELEKQIDNLWKQYGGLSGIITDTGDVIEKIDKKNYEEQIKEWYSTKPIETKEDSFLGFSTHMGIAQFDEDLENGIGYISEMSPHEYLERCAYDIFDSTYESAVLGADPTAILQYAKQMSEGVEFNMGYLDYTSQKQEGRHRAMAAELLGIEKIPVYIRR